SAECEKKKDDCRQTDDRQRPVAEILSDRRVVEAGRVEQLTELAHLFGLQAVDQARPDLARDLLRLERVRLCPYWAAAASPPTVRDDLGKDLALACDASERRAESERHRKADEEYREKEKKDHGYTSISMIFWME